MVFFEDICITKNGKTIAKISNPNISTEDSITGILEGKASSSIDRVALKEERLTKYEINN